jgi:glycerol-3-phosphate dehydrogenase subunit B
MTEGVLVIGAGPAGLLAAWTARQRGARVKVLASGIGTTHVMPGWLRVLDGAGPLDVAVARFAANHPDHPYALAGADAIQAGVLALRQACDPQGLAYVGGLQANLRLPTALGAVVEASYVPESFVAGDLSNDAPMLIAGPDGWRDFYPLLCAGNLSRQGYPARGATFALPEAESGKFDATPVALARLLDRPEIRKRLTRLLKPRLEGAKRVGFPAVLGLEGHAETWRDLQDRLGVPIFEIPTLPPSVPGMRLFQALRKALARSGVQILLDMPVENGVIEGQRAASVIVPDATGRMIAYRADRYVLTTGGLYGGGISTDHRGTMREIVFGLPVETPGGLGDWFEPQFLSDRSHPVHRAGVRANRRMQPVDADGRVLMENVHVAGRLLAGCQPHSEGSTEGVWLGTAHRAGVEATSD